MPITRTARVLADVREPVLRERGRRHLAVLGTAALLVLAGCGSDDDAATPPSSAGSQEPLADPADARYRSTEVTGRELVEGTEVAVGFDGRTLSVSAGCNTQFGTYELTEGTLRWTGEPGSTLKGCPPELEEQDRWMATLFTEGVDATTSGTALRLTGQEVTIVLDQDDDNDLGALLGRTWTVVGTVTDNRVRRLPQRARRPRLDVGADGLARLATGCNTGRTVVRITGDTLTFGPTSTTRLRCRRPAREIERRVLAVLDGPADHVHADGSVLLVVRGEDGLLFELT